MLPPTTLAPLISQVARRDTKTLLSTVPSEYETQLGAICSLLNNGLRDAFTHLRTTRQTVKETAASEIHPLEEQFPLNWVLFELDNA